VARLWIDEGLNHYLGPKNAPEIDRVYLPERRHLIAAQDAWRRASRLVPWRLDCAYYLGTVQAHLDNARPDLVEAAFGPLLRGTADQALRADALNNVGDAYFKAGEMAQARRRYAESFDIYNMPELFRINYRAQRRLGGL
jgi:hypothetical protein